MSDSHRKPDFILYLVKEGANPNDKASWIRFGAAWKASKGFSFKIEEGFRLFPPFNNPRVGLALMPFEERSTSNERDESLTSAGNSNRRGRR